MKISILLLFAFLNFNCATEFSPAGEEYAAVLANYQPTNSLKNIEEKISNAFNTSMKTGSNDELSKLDEKLATMYQENNQNLILYWRAYLNFYQAIYHITKEEDTQQAKKATHQAMEWLEAMENKNSEDHALLAMLKGFSIQFASGIKAGFISGKASDHAQRAIALDSLNMRAYYVAGSNDFYTPENFGGGKKAEGYFKKALSCPDQKIKNEYLPKWGRAEAYELLLRFYIRNENWEAAKSTFKTANELFPNNYQISQLAIKLVGK